MGSNYSTAPKLPPDKACDASPSTDFNPFSFNTWSNIVKSNIPDRSGCGLTLAKKPKSYALLADWNSDSLSGSYVKSILEKACFSSSSAIDFPVSFFEFCIECLYSIILMVIYPHSFIHICLLHLDC